MKPKQQLTILLYHGVTESTSPGIENFSGKHISAEIFEKQMRQLQKNAVVLSLDEVVELTNKNKAWPNNSVVITFDDGFANNHEVAAPILDTLQLPAIFYVCAGMINTNLMFWVDQIEDMINQTTKSSIQITLEKKDPIKFNLSTDQNRIDAVQRIKFFCKQINANKRNRVMIDLQSETGVVPNVEHGPNYKMMSWDQLHSLYANSRFTIGGHTLYHDIMTSVSKEKMILDVKTCQGLLSHNLACKMIHFSYPEGQREHYNEEVIKVLKNEAVITSPSAINGLNPPGSDLFHLRRIMPGFHGVSIPPHLQS